MEILLDNIGYITTVTTQYHPLTQALVAAYKMARSPQSKMIYDAWDTYTRGLIALGATQTHVASFSTVKDDADVTQTVYNIPALTGANVTILQVTIEGVGVDRNSPLNINTETGDVTYADAYVNDEGEGQFIEILYKK